MYNNNSSSEISAEVVPICVNIHTAQQTDKTSVFMEVATLTDDQFIKFIWLAELAATYCF